MAVRKRLLKQRTLWVGVAYFLVLLSIALWVRDIPNQPDAFNTTLQQISTGSLGSASSDPASFAKGAIDLADDENGWISGANEWIFNLWPPGFMLLEASIINVLGPEVPVILVLQILAAVLYSIVLVLLYSILNANVKSWMAAIILPLLIFAFPVSRVFLLQPKGIVLGESFSIGFFLISILLTFRSVTHHSLRYAAFAGICLALSAYFRSQFEFILLVLSGWGIFLIIAVQITRKRTSIDPKLLKSAVKTIVVVLLVAHAATIPWRAYRWTYFYQGSPSWVTTNDLYYGNSVMTSEHLLSLKAGWLVDGGANLVCRIDPSTCGDKANAKKLFFRTFITHPVEWCSLKFDLIGKYWFSSIRGHWTAVDVKSSFMDIVTNGLLLIAIIALVPLILTRKVRSHRVWIFLMWFVPSLFSAYMLIFTFAPLEVRYFYFPKIAGITILLIVTGLYFRPAKNSGMGNSQSEVEDSGESAEPEILMGMTCSADKGDLQRHQEIAQEVIMKNKEKNSYAEKQRVLVLGGLGFIGSHLCRLLVREGHKVRIFDKLYGSRNLIADIMANVEIEEGDAERPEDVLKALDGIDVAIDLIHTTVPGTSMRDPAYDVQTNVAAHAGWLSQLHQTKLKRIIYISSGGTVYGIPQKNLIGEDHPTEPISSYGITKLAIEKYIAMYAGIHNIDYRICRPANVYGVGQHLHVGQGVVGVFLERCLKEQPIEIWGDGSVSRDYIYVVDMVQAIVQLISHQGNGRIFNISSGLGYSLNDIIAIIRDDLKLPVKVNYVKSRKFDVQVNVLDNSLIMRETVWKSQIDLSSGMRLVSDYLKSSL